MKVSSSQIQCLYKWYQEHHRPLPWRTTKDPYKIWISETMLQQTTTQAVIPFYERFLERFPQLKDLSQASLEEVYEYWSGLGYYSRARNLHRAAQMLDSSSQFPKTHKELLELPGFGPYTSRAVASLAFEEPVGVLDGNVIRVLCRVHDLDGPWWKTAFRKELQEISDQWVQGAPPSAMNQALMELGATICTPRSPSCLLCPLKRTCLSRKRETISQRPQPRPRKEKVLIYWEIQNPVRKNKVLLDRGHKYPILKSQPLPLGQMKTVSKKPKHFHFKHNNTHHEIYVFVDSSKKSTQAEDGVWVQKEDLAKVSPNSLVKKVVNFVGLSQDGSSQKKS